MMTAPATRTAYDLPFTVGDWEVDPRSNELHRDGEMRKLEPKVMRVLCFLASRAGRVISREELEAEAWPRMVVTSDAVTSAVIKLRKALGDEARRPRYIETVSKAGYRLIADVSQASARTPVRMSTVLSRHRRLIRPSFILLLAVVIGVALWLVASRKPPLRWITVETSEAQAKVGIAVLPFENLGTAPDQDYFAGGITEDLTTDLSKLPALRVIARDSTLAYKGGAEDAKTIARLLGVDYVLRGSVQRQGERIRLNVHLIDGNSAANVWVERYDRQIEDIFTLQDEMVARIVSALQVEIDPAARNNIMRRNLASVASYDAFLRGLDHFNRGSVEDTRLAIQHYEHSIALDPGFARPYAGLAMAYTRGVVNNWDLGSHYRLDRAAVLVEKAKRLDPTLPQIYFVEGYNELFRHNYDAAIRSAEQAISIKPSYADAYALLAWILHFAGRPVDGLASMQQAVQLNPRVPAIYRAVRGILYYSADATEEALTDLESAAEINPSYQLQRLWLVAAYAAAGRIDDAQWEGDEILMLDPDFTLARVEQALPIRDPIYRERFLSDLRRAGLPQ